MGGTPWGKFFWKDWLSDIGLRRCSYAARGLWIDMLAIAADCDPIGHLALNGEALSTTDLARITGGSETEVRTLIDELERNGVFSRTRRAVIYSRRMVADTKKQVTALKNGKMGGNPNLSKQTEIFPLDNRPDKGGVKARDARDLDARGQKEYRNPSLRSELLVADDAATRSTVDPDDEDEAPWLRSPDDGPHERPGEGPPTAALPAEPELAAPEPTPAPAPPPPAATRRKRPPGPVVDDVDQAVAAYNEVAERVGLPVATKLTAERRAKLRQRLGDAGGLDGWHAALAKLEASPHCRGENDRGWRADLGFLLQRESFVRLTEGRYDDRRNGQQHGPPAPPAALTQALDAALAAGDQAKATEMWSAWKSDPQRGLDLAREFLNGGMAHGRAA